MSATRERPTTAQLILNAQRLRDDLTQMIEDAREWNVNNRGAVAGGAPPLWVLPMSKTQLSLDHWLTGVQRYADAQKDGAS